jgi:hypothetical protein
MEIRLNDEQIKAAVTAALFEHLTEDSKRLMIETALTHLLTPPDVQKGYQTIKGESPIARIFREAFERYATQYVRSILEDPQEPYRGRLEQACREAFDKILSESELPTKMANAIADGIEVYFRRG